MGSGVGLAHGVLGVPTGQVGGDTFMMLSKWPVRRFPAGVLNKVSKSQVLFMSFDVLICLFPNMLSPLNHGGGCPASVIWVFWGETYFFSAASDTNGVARQLLTALPFPCRRSPTG